MSYNDADAWRSHHKARTDEELLAVRALDGPLCMLIADYRIRTVADIGARDGAMQFPGAAHVERFDLWPQDYTIMPLDIVKDILPDVVDLAVCRGVFSYLTEEQRGAAAEHLRLSALYVLASDEVPSLRVDAPPVDMTEYFGKPVRRIADGKEWLGLWRV